MKKVELTGSILSDQDMKKVTGGADSVNCGELTGGCSGKCGSTGQGICSRYTGPNGWCTCNYGDSSLQTPPGTW